VKPSGETSSGFGGLPVEQRAHPSGPPGRRRLEEIERRRAVSQQVGDLRLVGVARPHDGRDPGLVAGLDQGRVRGDEPSDGLAVARGDRGEQLGSHAASLPRRATDEQAAVLTVSRLPAGPPFDMPVPSAAGQAGSCARVQSSGANS
jgi:hypothetical protein